VGWFQIFRQETSAPLAKIRKGYIYSNDQPGFGIDIDEKAAVKYPYKTDFESRGNDRMLDGTIVGP
jgi:mannonate dehydratase